MNGRRILPAVVITVTLGVGIVIGTLISQGVRAARSMNGAAPAAAPLPAPSPADLSNSFSRVADMVEPAVVNINTETVVRVGRRRFHGQEDNPFGDFFDKFFQGDPDGQGGGGGGGGEFRQPSLGSGIILDRNGYILTNYHVIMQPGENKPVDKIRVRLHGEDEGGRGHEAKVVGRDRETDLAVIKIETDKPLPFAQLGDSDSTRVGDWVLAIGSPFGLDSTVTAGILSAKGRDIEGGATGQFKRYLQTDAAINPGNSGGPLVNLAGQVIGINTAIATNRGTYDGVGFAVPSNTARKVYNQLVAGGSVQRGAIGVSFQNINNESVLRSFGADHGVVVNSVEPGSTAEKAGVKRGDVIITVNGKPIREGDELVGIVSETEIGKKLKVEVLRDRKPMTFDVEVGDRNKTFSRLRGPADDEDAEDATEEAGGMFGLSGRNLTSEQASDVAEKLNLNGNQGILVTDVKADGFAADVGIVRGDIILSINHQPIKSVNDITAVQNKLKSGDDVLFFVARRTGRSYTTIYLADRLP